MEILWKIIPVLAAVVASAKILYELALGGRGRLREEYRFAHDFMQQLKNEPDMHPFVRDKGYQAIAGDASLSAEEVAYLLSLENPGRALRDYALGRPYLEHLTARGNLRLDFRPEYKSAYARGWRKVLYGGLYFGLASTSFAPLYFSAALGMSAMQSLAVFLAGLPICFWLARTALTAAVRVHRAEKLVKNQARHSQRIVIAPARPASARLVSKQTAASAYESSYG